jgi:hypothetical protein
VGITPAAAFQGTDGDHRLRGSVLRERQNEGGGPAATAAYWAIALVFAGFFVWLHVQVGYSFPTPWTDEVAYLWQGIALGRSGSPVAPELVPDLHLMWIPPGFMLVNAFFFRLFGFSLDLARWLSAAEILVCFAALWALARRLRAPWPSLLLCGLFLWSARFVLAGNIGRMEALVLACVGPGILLLSRGRWVSGWALTACAALVHPNGVFFTGGATLFLLLQPDLAARLRNAKRHEWWVLGLVACGFLGYGLYVVAQWDEFTAQMGAQFGRKLDRNLMRTLSRPINWLFLTGLVGLFLRSFRRDESVSLFSCFALAGWLTCFVGQEWWYEVNRALAMLLLGLAVIEVCSSLPLSNALRRLAAPSGAVLVTALFWWTGVLPFPPGDPLALKGSHMHARPDWKRVDRDALAAIAERLERWTECGKRVVVRVYPRAESLLLYEELGGETAVLFSSPPFVFQELAKDDERYVPPNWDAYLIHLTREPIPYSWAQRNAAFIESGIAPGSDEHLLRFDGPLSQWYLRVRKMRVLSKCFYAPSSEDG